jgi:hypothetical protein
MIGGGIAVLAVILRIFARLPCCGGNWGHDDRAMLATMVILSCVSLRRKANKVQVPTLPLTGLSVVLADAGLGRDMWNVPFDSISDILHVGPLFSGRETGT